jgi:hypothetical protein
VKFRLKALGIHLVSSALVLGLILGALFLGWYRWPGWYLADASKVIQVMVLVDVVVGPLLTFVIASEKKPRRELKRDVGVIVAIQLIALSYGSLQLWNGRPLYYAFSESLLQTIQAYDIPSSQADIGRTKNPSLAPHWYSTVRWISAPLPADPQERERILAAVKSGGDDVISMPLYYRSWEAGLPALKLQLKRVDEVGYLFMQKDRDRLKATMQAAGLRTDEANSIALSGRAHPLLAVFDVNTMKLVGLFKSQ